MSGPSTIVLDGTEETVRPILVRETCAALPVVPETDRVAIAGADAASANALMGFAPLRRIEVRPPPAPAPASDTVRVCFWNIERGGDPGAVAAFLDKTGASIALLCEVDNGMARTGQAHVAAEVAALRGSGYAFAVEFIELGLGNARESAAHEGATNRLGYHGNALVTAHPIEAPALVRLPGDGGWFSGRRQERRIGSRIAVLATIAVAGRPVVFAATHLESHSAPELRTMQTEALLRAIDAYAPGLPVLIGGDLNTRTDTKDAVREAETRLRLLSAAPQRFHDPTGWEPLFAAAAAGGYDWRGCNDSTPTERGSKSRPPGVPRFRLDWFLSRGLACRTPQVVPAVAPDGTALSDHDAILVDVALR